LTLGAFLSLFALYQILAFISYLFTWKADQNLVLNKGLFSFLFSGTEEIQVGNHLGKLGAWISHKFIFDWFGLASFLFPLMFIVAGLFLLLRIKILPVGRTIGHSLIGIVVISL